MQGVTPFAKFGLRAIFVETKEKQKSCPQPIATRWNPDTISGVCRAVTGIVVKEFLEQLYVPREESFPNPLKDIDVARHTQVNLDYLDENTIKDYWNVLAYLEWVQEIHATQTTST